MKKWVIRGKQAQEIKQIHERLCKEQMKSGDDNSISLNQVVLVMSWIGLERLKTLSLDQFLKELDRITKNKVSF